MDYRPHVNRIGEHTDLVIEEIKNINCLLNEVIIPYPMDFDMVRCFTEYYYWCDSESVNIFTVEGTAHPDYTGVRWIDMLRVGKRMSLNLSLLVKNPEYYFQTKKKEPAIHYTKIDDTVYITGDGNHRTAIAKVLFFYTGQQILHGIEFREFRINKTMLDIYNRIKENLLKQSLPVDIKVIQKNTKREDTPGWEKNYYDLAFLLTNLRTGKSIEIRKEQAEILLAELSRGKPLIGPLAGGQYRKFLYWK